MPSTPLSRNGRQPGKAKDSRTILVVDDYESVRLSLEYLLRLSGYNVVAAESGPKAIALAASDSVDGALIDVLMPVMNGFDTCRCLQAQASERGRELRVWFITGAFASDFERRGAELGALGVFAKPFEVLSFLARLEHGFSSPLPPLLPTMPSAVDGASAHTSP